LDYENKKNNIWKNSCKISYLNKYLNKKTRNNFFQMKCKQTFPEVLTPLIIHAPTIIQATNNDNDGYA